MKFLLSIDLEDWFQVENLRGVYPRESWFQQELRLERKTDWILETLSDETTKATFFILGWVAEKLPHIVRKIPGLLH